MEIGIFDIDVDSNSDDLDPGGLRVAASDFRFRIVMRA